MRGVDIKNVPIDAATLSGKSQGYYFQNFVKVNSNNVSSNKWYRLAEVTSPSTTGSSILIAISVYQGEQVLSQTYLLSRATEGSTIKQLGANNYKNAGINLRVVRVNDGTCYIEFKNTFGGTFRFGYSIVAYDAASIINQFSEVSETASGKIECTITGTNMTSLSSGIQLNDYNTMNINDIVKSPGGGGEKTNT